MARFPGDFLQKVRDNTNILDVVGSYVSLKKKGNDTGRAARFTRKRLHLFLSLRKMDYIIASAVMPAVMFFPLWKRWKTSALRKR